MNYNYLKNVLKEYNFVHIEPNELNELMTNKSLNEIEAMKIGELITNFEKKLKDEVVNVFVDSPDPNPSKFTDRISKYVTTDAVIESSNKAEDKWICVAAASIFAKQERDDEIEKIKDVVDEDFGAGYPSDPKTISFLKK